MSTFVNVLFIKDLGGYVIPLEAVAGQGFAEVVTYDDAADTAITLQPRQFARILLAEIGSPVSVTFEPGTVDGQIAGLGLITQLDGEAGDVGYSGPVDFLFPSPAEAGECQFFVWSASAAVWSPVAAYRVPPGLSFKTTVLYDDVNTITPAIAELALIDFAAIEDNVSVNAPGSPADGNIFAVRVQSQDETVLYEVQYQAGIVTNAPVPRYTGDADFFVFSASSNEWFCIGTTRSNTVEGYELSFQDSDLVAGVLSVSHGLGNPAASVTIYDDTNAMRALITDYTVLSTGNDSTDITIIPSPIAGTWRLFMQG